MNFEKLAYLPLGNNVIIGPKIKKQLKFLKDIVPEEFKEKELYDLGCGDGKVTLKLKNIFCPRKLYGCDSNSNLVWRAKRKGIEAEALDLEKETPEGELAVFWGVLHHLKNQEKVLERIKNNFQYFFLREPLMKNKKSLFELGNPFFEKDIDNLLKKTLKNFKKYKYQDSIFVFWER